MANVTINVTVRDGAASAPNAEARRQDDITWSIQGDVQPDQEVVIGRFRPNSPMAGGDNGRRRNGNGPINDSVRADATPGSYSYDITLVRAGVASVLDPEIQIKP